MLFLVANSAAHPGSNAGSVLQAAAATGSQPDQRLGLHHKASLLNRLDDATRRPAAPRAIVNVALRAVGIDFLVDDERTPILIKDAERSGQQGDPTGEREQDAVPPVHVDVDQVAGMEGVIAVGGGVARGTGI